MNTITFGVLQPCIRLHLRNMDIRYSDQLPVAHNRPRPYLQSSNTPHILRHNQFDSENLNHKVLVTFL